MLIPTTANWNISPIKLYPNCICNLFVKAWNLIMLTFLEAHVASYHDINSFSQYLTQNLTFQRNCEQMFCPVGKVIFYFFNFYFLIYWSFNSSTLLFYFIFIFWELYVCLVFVFVFVLKNEKRKDQLFVAMYHPFHFHVFIVFIFRFMCKGKRVIVCVFPSFLPSIYLFCFLGFGLPFFFLLGASVCVCVRGAQKKDSPIVKKV